MNAKELKSVLRQARDAIKDKEYKTALKHCRAVLSVDKSNYNAWVFVGVAAQEMEQHSQAVEAFERAIDIAPGELLAWQGLSNFYEKQENKEKLFDTLKKLVELLNKDKSKQLEIVDKLENVAKTMSNNEKIVEALQLHLDLLEDNELKEQELYWEVIKEISSVKNLSPKVDAFKKEALKKIVQHSTFSEDYCKQIITLCVQPLFEDDLISKCLEITEIISLNDTGKVMCLEFLLKSSLSTYIRKGKVTDYLEETLNAAKECAVQEWLCSLVQGLLYFLAKKYNLACQVLKEGVEKKNDNLEGLYLLCKSQQLLHLHKDVESNAKAGLRVAVKTCASSNVIGSFYLFLGEALTGIRNWEAAFKAYEKCVEYCGRTPEVLKSFCIALLEVGHVEKAQKIYAELYSDCDNPAMILQLEGYIHIFRQEYPVALKKLRESVSLEESAFTLHLIGCVLWKTEEHEKAVKIFVKAAALDPYFAKNFVYIGHYYMQFSSHKRKAQQCYQKAFDLDDTNEEAGKSLSNVLKALGEDEANMALLRRVTMQAPLGSCKWAWTQLGLLQLERDLASDAIFSLQNAVRADPQSSYGWECLGDAYLKRGSHESALKSYEKASELNPKANYPLYQVSTIQKTRGLYEDAVGRYKNLLQLEPSYIPALIGLAETLLLLGKKLFNECLFGRARDCLQESLNVLSRVVPINTSLACLWKLAGDACTFSSHLGLEYLPIVIPAEFQTDCHSVTGKENLLVIGAKFYARALSIKENLSSLWHDLGVNCYFQSLYCNHVAKADFAKKAFICLQKAVSIAPANYEHWTLLGIIAVSSEIQDFAMGQHAFIKSIEIESNNVEAWTNLGILYLENGNIDLAHNAFKVAQSLDPTYPLCWIGQAVIAHKVKHSETMDLYRHAATLGTHTEALLGYGRAVCQALLDTSNRETELYKYNIEQMDAVVVASDCVTKYTANNGCCAQAFNILGMLLERQKLYGGALKAYKRAVDLCAAEEGFRANYARVLSTVEENVEAIAEYMKLKKVDPPLLCSFALTLYKNKEFQQAYKVFERALHASQVSGDKSHILVAMAMVLRKVPGSEANNVQKLLLESSQVKPSSIYGLLALWALCILNKQLSHTAAVEKELTAFKCQNEYSSSIALLAATQSFIKDGCNSARVRLLHAVHSQPNNCDIWTKAAFCMLQWDSEYADSVAVFSQIAVFHGGNKELSSQIFALSRLAAGYKNVSLSAAQKAVHIQPDKLTNWITLAAACHVAGKDHTHIGWIFSFVKNVAKEQGIKRDVLGWLICMEAFHYIYCKDLASASRIIKQTLGFTFNSQIQSVLQLLNAFVEVLSDGKLDPLVLCMNANPGVFLGWQILVKYLIHREKYIEAERTLGKLIIASSRCFPKLKIFPLLQLGVLSYKAMSVLNDKAKWIKLGEDSVTEAVKISPNNQAARFLQGLIAFENGNTSLARRSLEKVIFKSGVSEPNWMEVVSLKLLVSIYAKKKDNEALKKVAQCFPKNEELQFLLLSASEGQ